MIKQTFYNLPKEKQQRIIKASIDEIIGNSYDKISINKIVKNAVISRGSFYQYFDEKGDLFELIMQNFTSEIKNKFIDIMISNKGDILLAALDIFDFMANSPTLIEYSNLLKALFTVKRVDIEFFDSKKCGCDKTFAEKLKSLINTEMYNTDGEDNINYIINIVASILFRHIFELFVIGSNKNEVRKNLNCVFMLIKNGIARR